MANLSATQPEATQESIWFEIARRWGRAHGDEFLAIQMFRAMIPVGSHPYSSGAYQNTILTIREELEQRYGPAKE